MVRRAKITVDNSGKEAYPDITCNGTMEGEPWQHGKTTHGFDGTFPFEVFYEDYLDGGFEVKCPFCGNAVLCDDYDEPAESYQIELWTKRFCDECGAKIIVPEDSPNHSDCLYEDIASCADIEGWTLFCDENNQRFHLMHDEHCQEALLNDWKLIRIEDIPKKEK